MILSQNEVEAQVDKLQKIIEESDEYNLNSAFVTFHDRHDAVIVLKVFASDGNEEIVAELAPDTDDVIWNDLRPSSSPLDPRDFGGCSAEAMGLGFLRAAAFGRNLPDLRALGGRKGDSIPFGQVVANATFSTVAFWEWGTL